MVAWIALSLAGCEESSSPPLRVTGWISAPIEETLTRSLVRSFAERHPDIRLIYEPITASYMDKLLLMLGTRTAPDVVMLEAFWIPLLVSYDVLLPLDDLTAQDADFALGDFEPVLLEAFRRDGKLYGLPKDYTTLALYYNPAMFSDAGLPLPPKTWDEFAADARRLTRDRNGDGRVDQYGYGHGEALEYSLPFVWQNRGEYFDRQGHATFTEPAFADALGFLRQMQTEGSAVLPTDVGAAWNMDAFGRQRVAMAISGLWAVNFLKETYANVPYAVAPLPAGKEAASVAFSVGYVIPKHTRQPREAWQVLRYLTSREGGRLWAQTRIGLPPRRSLAQSLRLADDPLIRPFVESLKEARVWQFEVNQRILDETETTLQAIFRTGAPVEPALRDLRTRLERARLLCQSRAALEGRSCPGASH